MSKVHSQKPRCPHPVSLLLATRRHSRDKPTLSRQPPHLAVRAHDPKFHVELSAPLRLLPLSAELPRVLGMDKAEKRLGCRRSVARLDPQQFEFDRVPFSLLRHQIEFERSHLDLIEHLPQPFFARPQRGFGFFSPGDVFHQRHHVRGAVALVAKHGDKFIHPHRFAAFADVAVFDRKG